MFRKVFMIISLFYFSHCSTLATRFDGPGMGHPYVGLERAVKFLECGLYISAPALFIPLPFYIADIPLSFVLDTVLVPFDLLIKGKHPRYPIAGMSCH